MFAHVSTMLFLEDWLCSYNSKISFDVPIQYELYERSFRIVNGGPFNKVNLSIPQRFLIFGDLRLTHWLWGGGGLYATSANHFVENTLSMAIRGTRQIIRDYMLHTNILHDFKVVLHYNHHPSHNLPVITSWFIRCVVLNGPQSAGICCPSINGNILYDISHC